MPATRSHVSWPVGVALRNELPPRALCRRSESARYRYQGRGSRSGSADRERWKTRVRWRLTGMFLRTIRTFPPESGTKSWPIRRNDCPHDRRWRGRRLGGMDGDDRRARRKRPAPRSMGPDVQRPLRADSRGVRHGRGRRPRVRSGHCGRHDSARSASPCPRAGHGRGGRPRLRTASAVVVDVQRGLEIQRRRPFRVCQRIGSRASV
jgi:hypothetical protein